jgi:hypothetical protein
LSQYATDCRICLGVVLSCDPHGRLKNLRTDFG